MRVASLSPAVTEILFALELGEFIVCTDQFSNAPEQVRSIPHLKHHTNVAVTDLLPFEPELVCTSTVIQQQLAEHCRQSGLSVFHTDPRTIEEVYETIKHLGVLFQKENNAEDLILSMRQAFNDVKKKAALLPQSLKVYIEEWHNPPYASGNWVPDVSQFAGCKQFPIIEERGLSKEVHFDEVQAWDPDMIILSYCGAGLHVDPALMTEREGWSGLRAVEEGNVRVIDDSLLNRLGPRLIDGARHLYGWAFEYFH